MVFKNWLIIFACFRQQEAVPLHLLVLFIVIYFVFYYSIVCMCVCHMFN